MLLAVLLRERMGELAHRTSQSGKTGLLKIQGGAQVVKGEAAEVDICCSTLCMTLWAEFPGYNQNHG